MSIEAAYDRAEGSIEVDRSVVDVLPIAVSLAERAVALGAIMEYLDKASRTKGSKTQLENGGGEFGRRYKSRAAEVQEGAERATVELRAGFDEGLRTLAATDALEVNGYDEDAIERARMGMQMAINEQFGVGKSNAKQRATTVARARRYPGPKKGSS